MSSADIQSIDISAPSDTISDAIAVADVVVTTLDLEDKVRGFPESAKKTVITVGSTNDVSLLLNILHPQ